MHLDAKGYPKRPLAVLEAIEYCKQNLDVLEADRRMEDETLRKYGLDQPPPSADGKRDP